MYKLIFIIALAFFSCSDDGAQTNNLSNNVRDLGVRDLPKGSDAGSDLNESDTTVDAGNSGDSGGDAQTDMSTDCDPLLDTTFDVQQKAQIGELYARASWSGAKGWVVYSAVPDDEEEQSIFLARVSCSGEVATPPEQISPVGSEDRHLQPVIVSKGGTTFIAWYSQPNGGGQSSIWFLSFNEDGTQITNEPVNITPKNGQGDAISNLFWETTIAAISADELVIGFSYATTEGFRIGIQRLNKTGALEEFITPIANTADQKSPSLSVDDDGNITLSWIRESMMERVSYLASIPMGATQIVPASGVPSKPLSTPNALARVSKHASESGIIFQAFQVTTAQRNDILIRNASDLSSVNSLTFGLTQRNFRPSIASGKKGGAVAWYRGERSPSRGNVMLQAFNDELEGGAEVTFDLVKEGIPPYGPDITYVENDIYFITWSEGESGRDAEVKARFVKLTAP